jgi:hypothetical protein
MTREQRKRLLALQLRLRALAPTHADAPGAYEAVLAELERRGAEKANPCQT